MDSLGLSGDLGAYFDALRGPHEPLVEFRVLDLAGNYLGTVDHNKDEAGQVNGDASSDIPLSLTGATVLDVDGFFDGPGMNRQVQVRYTVPVPALGRSVACDVFTGPVIRPPGRDGELVSLECQSGEAIAARATSPKTYPAANAVATLQKILTEKCGQTRFAFPSLPDRLDDPVDVGREDELRPLVQCRAIARSLDLHLFRDGGGVWRLRTYPTAPVLDLAGLVVSRQPAEPLSEIVNQWRVVGKVPKDHTVVVSLPVSHDYSPESLAVNGVRDVGVFEVVEENTKLSTRAKARARANRLRTQGIAQLVERTILNIVPVPNLHLHDPLRDGNDVHTLRTFSLPLGPSGEMTVGYDAPLGRG